MEKISDVILEKLHEINTHCLMQGYLKSITEITITKRLFDKIATEIKSKYIPSEKVSLTKEIHINLMASTLKIKKEK